MAAQQTFRTAFNGFNREDVVRYIEYLNTKHTAEVNQLNSELAFLRSKLDGNAPVEAEADPIVEQQAARIRELFDQCKAQEQTIADLTAQLQASREAEARLSASQAEKAQLADELAAATAQQNSYRSRMEEELEAYRRAERTERLARERTEQMYRQANGAIADATVKVDDAASQIGQLTARVMQQLTELQNAVAGSKQALRDAAAPMYTIRPSGDNQ